MKRGDLIEREVVMKDGDVLVLGCDTPEEVNVWMKQDCERYYGLRPLYRVEVDSINEGKHMAVVAGQVLLKRRAKVSWRVDNEVAIEFNDGSNKIIDIGEDKGWKVVVSASPTYQSSVAQMSDEELRTSIDVLRRTRVTPAKPLRRKAQSKAPVDKNDPIALALSKLAPDKKIALMRKLGMVD